MLVAGTERETFDRADAASAGGALTGESTNAIVAANATVRRMTYLFAR